jgi:TonB family protein
MATQTPGALACLTLCAAAAFAQGTMRVGKGVSAPSLISKTEPEYTEEARRARLIGMVVLYIEVYPDGRAHNMKVIRSLGLGLDEEAMATVERWKFRPGQKEGKPVTVQATVEVNSDCCRAETTNRAGRRGGWYFRSRRARCGQR